jgi:quinol monooxygenase YgiN
MVRFLSKPSIARLGLAIAALAATVFGPLSANAQNATFYTVSYVEVGPMLAKVGAAALRAYRDAERKRASAANLEVYQSIDRPNQFVILGAWSDAKAFEAHQVSEQTKALNGKLATLLASPIDVRRHGALSENAAKPGKAPLVVVTHVDAVPPQKDNAIAALKQLAADSHKQSGNLRFDIWQQADRPNHFTLVESWGSRGNFDLHQMQRHTRDFRAKLAPISGSPYDERLYKTLK